ncbi:MAG: hypothetical protein FJ148_20165 [Deltaproteobacteria bacterium]|nr:hypothetical protein [Deltaproteobacteria bacterium]
MRKHLAGFVALLVIALASGLTNCGGGGTGGGPAQRPPTFVLNAAGTSSNAGTMVLGLERASIDANNSDTVGVIATVLDPIGDPIGGLPITFEASFRDVTFVGGSIDPVTEFPVITTITDSRGNAYATVRSGGTPGWLTVQAAAPRNFRLGSAIFLNLTDVGFISGDLQVLPNEINVIDPAPGTQIQFLITGGRPFQDPDPPYFLQNQNSGFGSAELLDDGEFPVVVEYTLTGRGGGALMGSHVFTIVDGAGDSVSATVTVTFTELEIMPNTASLVTGQTQVFALTGGVPPYACNPSGGTLTPTTILDSGGTTTFTAGPSIQSTTFTIVCSDQSGQVATATVTVAPLPSPSGNGTPVPSATPQTPNTIVVQANPATLNGVQGGASNITATVLDQNLNRIAGVNVLFELAGQSGEPTAQVPSLSNFTAVTDGQGQAVTVLTVPGGTPPQFLSVSAQAGNASGTGQVGVTSQSTQPPGPPARLTAALFKSGAFGDNNDGTYITILSALVTDANGNPVADGVEVDWGPVQPTSAAVVSPSFTNGQPPCNTDPYTSNTGLAINPQPGTALTCVIYPATIADLAGNVKVSVAGTTLMTTANISFPGPAAPVPTPRPTVQPPTPSPAPTPTPAPPLVVPANASLAIGQSQVFAITRGVPPYTVNASGGTAVPTTVLSTGGTFTYTKNQAGTFTVVVVDSNGQVGTATVMDLPTPVPTPTP